MLSTQSPSSSRPAINPPSVEAATLQIQQVIEDMKGEQITVLNVSSKTDIADNLIIATGRSQRHLKAIAEHICEAMKKVSFFPLGVEGAGADDWVLIDFGDIVVHIMSPSARELYALERLWGTEDLPYNSNRSID